MVYARGWRYRFQALISEAPADPKLNINSDEGCKAVAFLFREPQKCKCS